MKSPWRATASSAAAIPSRRTPSQPSPGTMNPRGTTRTCSPGVAHRQPSSRRGPRQGARGSSLGSGPPGASRIAIHSSMAARRSRSRAAIAAAFVAAISVPIVTSPRARRVVSRQPVAASAGRRRASPPRSSRAAGDGLHERDGGEQRQVADRRDEAVVRARRPSRRARAPQASARARTRRGVATRDAAPPITHGRPRNRPPSAAPKPLVSRPAIGWPPTYGTPGLAGGAARRPLVDAVSVTVGAGRQGRTRRSAPSRRSSSRAGQRRRRQRPRGPRRRPAAAGIDRQAASITPSRQRVGGRPSPPPASTAIHAMAGRRPQPPVGRASAASGARDRVPPMSAETQQCDVGSAGRSEPDPSAAPPAPPRPSPPGTRSPRATPAGTARTTTGRSGRGRTG